MSDATVTLSLPAAVKQHVDERVAAGAYATADEYVRALIQADMRRDAEGELEARLLEGLDSGTAGPADWARIRADAYRLAGRDKPAEA